MSKVTSVAGAAALVPEGAVLAVGGVMDQMVPSAFLFELVRRRARNLDVVAVAAGFSVDLLIGGGCARSVSAAIVSFEDLGTSKLFRRKVEDGAVEFREYSELTMITRLRAAGEGVTFLPTRAALGTDIIETNAEALRLIDCPFTGRRLLACAALSPDVAIVHAEVGDELGNIQLSRKHIWHDLVIARAAKTVIVTVEEIVASDVVRSAPEKTVLPGFLVDAVVEAPRGAWPTQCPGRYQTDTEALQAWIDASRADDTLADLLGRWAS